MYERPQPDWQEIIQSSYTADELPNKPLTKTNKIMNSSIFTLNWKDLGKSILLTVITSLVNGLYQTIALGAFPTGDQLLSAVKVAGLAGLAYLLKNLLTNDEGKFLQANEN